MIALGSDHGGFELKQEVKKYLEEQGIAYKDYGCDSEEAVDYPVYGNKMIALGSDHGGFELKQEVKKYLEEQGIAYKDYGCDSEEAVDYPVYGKIKKYLEEQGIAYKDYGCDSEEAVDYPVYGKTVANAVASGECEKGILICGTGIGISITANKVKGIRCALCSDCFSAEATVLFVLTVFQLRRQDFTMTQIFLQWAVV